MRIGAFQLEEPLPALRDPHAFVVLKPWVDVGSVGSSTVAFLENWLNVQSLGKLVRPGNFFDFTRYRPIIRNVEGQREIIVPNVTINYAMGPQGNDFVFFHLLEPHMLGEYYTDSILRVVRTLGVRRYCLVGGMYDAVPHTKPLIVTGNASGEMEAELHKLGVRSSDYEGPTTITILIWQEAPKYGIEIASLIVHLPQYAQMDVDYAGQYRLLELLCSLYDFRLDLKQIKSDADEQYAKLTMAIDRDPQVKQVVERLEAYYKSRTSETVEEPPPLSPEVERFLRDMDKRFGQN